MYRQIKQIAMIVLAVGALFGVNSCCTKKMCLDAEEISEINFYNFSQTELDTIAVITYSKDSNFGILIDSSITRANLKGDYFSAKANNTINTNIDYKIKLLSTGQVFTLTNFEIEKEGCNSCFPYQPESEFYNRLSSYHVNGQKQAGRQINIYK
jgi:hypothetical protein